jgi:FtsZ-interacting cell division protein ZipA
MTYVCLRINILTIAIKWLLFCKWRERRETSHRKKSHGKKVMDEMSQEKKSQEKSHRKKSHIECHISDN